MGWGDGTLTNVEVLLEAADTSKGQNKERLLIQALNSARCIEDDYKRKNLVKLIEGKLRDYENRKKK